MSAMRQTFDRYSTSVSSMLGSSKYLSVGTCTASTRLCRSLNSEGTHRMTQAVSLVKEKSDQPTKTL
jgi:hypothetical protein